MQQSTSAKFWSFFCFKIGLFASAWMKIYCYWASFRISFISFFVFESFWFKSEQYLARWISAYLIYGDHQRGALDSLTGKKEEKAPP